MNDGYDTLDLKRSSSVGGSNYAGITIDRVLTLEQVLQVM